MNLVVSILPTALERFVAIYGLKVKNLQSSPRPKSTATFRALLIVALPPSNPAKSSSPAVPRSSLPRIPATSAVVVWVRDHRGIFFAVGLKRKTHFIGKLLPFYLNLRINRYVG
ncbi:hypothetical protein AVEN_45704-1 [Araneus ventricosus]|uniref:Uncharacterized protein n=1 Tax=Araneus ventricosus TaxID=182803 RepID=A0A4Y2VSQ6_ARAVE|nr:hypothetical protein AVEN_45482-1 [Araneus ventricosus]GBO27438.1 hypothetical protein AVEN_45704-1 [Araneus ventricosus]